MITGQFDGILSDLLIWGALLVGLVFLALDKRRRAGALTLVYFLDLSLGHVPGVLAYLDPSWFPEKVEATKIGFDVTLIGMSAFIVGAIVARILPRPATAAKAYQQTASSNKFSQWGWRVLTMGIASYFVILPVSALLPSLTAIASSMGSLLILGVWLLLYSAVIVKSGQRILIFAMVPLLPLATLVSGGFLGYGTAWALSVVAFYFCIARRRVWFYVLTPFVFFFGLSLFVTYAQQRDDIRDVVWYQNAGIMQRLSQVSKLVTDFQFLDLSNEMHLFALDDRLNQNYLVGMGVMRYREGQVELRYGTTVPLWALIPRVIWPDKPGVGGGGDLVTEFAGVTFAEGTSVGVGQVLEFYMNFAMPGVLGGFALVGFILARLDQKLMRAFAVGNIQGVVQTALPGLVMVSPLGNLLEIVVAVASAIIASKAIIRLKLLDVPPTQTASAKTSAQRLRAIGLR